MEMTFFDMALQYLFRAVIGGIVFVEYLQRDHARLPAYTWHGILELFPAIFPSYIFLVERIDPGLSNVLNVDIDLFDVHSYHLFNGRGYLFLYGCPYFNN